ncbi:MAG TPA: helix-turn-helix transcriptional regulator [Hanamia sp.]|nr:helix-turn-helix transcriptional regulator [Hanamia sp.]
MPFTDYDIESFKKAKSIIDADTTVHYSIESIAGKIGIGKTKLKIGFKEYFRMGLFAYLREQRMIKAAELLVETNKTIKEIARATGYKYRSNFISAFTGYHGLPPSKYRNLFSTR